MFDRLSLAQRIVVIVGLGFALRFLGLYLVGLGETGGWVGYAPLTSPGFGPPGSIRPWAQTLIWLALVAFWVIVSLYVLRHKPREAARNKGEQRP